MSGNANSGRRPADVEAKIRARKLVQIKEHNAADLRAKIQSAQVISRLAQHLDGKVELSPTQVKAAQILLDRTLPSLSSQELHHHDETAGLTESEMLARLQQLLAALPADAQAAVGIALRIESTH